MGEPIQQLQETYQDNLIYPEPLKRTIINYKKAHHGYNLDERDNAYIEYNTLREQQKHTEEIKIKKIQRLYDRDTETEWIVLVQQSRCKDNNNNIVECPIVEKLGVVIRPIANVTNDSRKKINSVTIVEKQNDYYIPFSKEKMIELFESSKDRHKIVCYVGYTRPTRVNPDDTIEGKKIIWNQDKFVNAPFSELVDDDEEVIKVLDQRKPFIIPNKVRDLNKNKKKNLSQRVESLADLLPSNRKNKVVQEIEDYTEENQEDQQQNVTNSIQNDTEKEYEELQNNNNNDE